MTEMDRGVVIFSVDLELAWGFNYLLKGSRLASQYLSIIREKSRRNVERLLEFSERFDIPITWGIVGHLFLSSCVRDDKGLPHPDMARPVLDVSKDWYSNDPCLDIGVEPLWYGSDLVQQIMESKIDHEIACHSFSHVDFSRCSKDVALSEIRKCKDIMKDYAIEPRTFIFPKDRVGHLSVLKQEGFKIFRFGIRPSQYDSGFLYLPNSLYIPTKEIICPSLGNTIEAGGLVGVPWSLFFQSPFPHNLGAMRLLMAARRGVDRVASEHKIFHITIHDYLEDDSLIHVLSNIFSHVSKLRDRKKLTTQTMIQYCSK
jgi:peptidoglycan/xylan/chitin deacetylase (PgdA/CDA1 family)